MRENFPRSSQSISSSSLLKQETPTRQQTHYRQYTTRTPPPLPTTFTTNTLPHHLRHCATTLHHLHRTTTPQPGGGEVAVDATHSYVHRKALTKTHKKNVRSDEQNTSSIAVKNNLIEPDIAAGSTSSRCRLGLSSAITISKALSSNNHKKTQKKSCDSSVFFLYADSTTASQI